MSLRVVLSLFGVAWLSVAHAERDPGQLLDGMSRAFRELNYDLSFVYVRDGQIEPMRLVHAAADGQERERLVHLNGVPREVLRENDTVTAYFANAKPWVLDKAAAASLWTRSLVENLTQMRRHYQILDRGASRIAGREAIELEVRSVDGHRFGYRLWLDAETKLLLRSDVVDINNRVLEQWQVVSFQVKERIPEADLKVAFAGSVPAEGVRVMPASQSSASDDQSWQVGWLPEGFTLRSRQLQNTNKGAPVHHLLFSDGVANISVYIAEEDAPGAAFQRTLRKGSVIIFDSLERNRRITVVGDVPTASARRIAASVRHQTSAGR